jgi:hypothetical protein
MLHFKAPVPEELRWLYEKSGYVLRRDLCLKEPKKEEPELFIQHFQPADKRTLEEAWFGLWETNFPFASDDFGNYYFVSVNADNAAKCLLFIDHDGGDTWKVADSTREFLSWTVLKRR